MAIIFIVLGLILTLILLFWIIKNYTKCKKILYAFKHMNCIVFGAKGTGKDLIFQWVIKKRKDKYFSNIDFGGQYKNISLNSVSIAPNTYQDFIQGNITQIKKSNNRENKDIYISDCGVYLPSQYDTTLYKQYPSFPLYYALSRHLYNSNVHCNTQNLERVWKSLREQSDYYIYCVQTIKIIPFILITKVITYDRYESAQRKLRPLTARVLNKYSKAEYDKYCAENGEIHTCYIFQLKSHIYYDSRAFHKIVFGRKAPSK